MPTNLTGSTIASTFPQILHINDGPTATEKTVHSGTGVETALKVGTTSASVGNVQFTGNTVQAITGDLTLGANIAFANAVGARSALGLGSMATQAANNVAITGGSIQNVTFSGSFSGMTLVSSVTLTGTTTTNGGNLRLSGNALTSTNTDGDISITPNGTGEVNVTNIDILSGKVPFTTITNRAYGQFYSTQDQTAAANTPTAVTFNNSDTFNAGVSVVSNTRITFAAAGDYDLYFNMQLANAENSDHEVTVWVRLNGTDVANSATRIVVPASGVGGTGFFAFNTILRVTSGQYVEVYWAPEDADVSLSYEAAEPSTPFARPAIPSVVLNATRVG